MIPSPMTGGARTTGDTVYPEGEIAAGEPQRAVGNKDEPDLSLRLVQELEGHTDRVWGVAWSPNGALLASCSGDKSLRIWEKDPSSASSSSSTWTCKAVLDEIHTRTVRSCEWAPGGRLLATASFDATTGIWESLGGQFECVATLEGHENEVKSVAWNASGMLLATCSRDKHVWIWEVQPGNEFECMSVLAGHTQDVKMVTWHPSKDILVSSSYDNSIKVWKEDGDGDDWRCVQTLAEPGIYSHPSDKIGGYRELAVFSFGLDRGHTSTVWSVSFDSKGDRLVSCSDDLTLMIWDTKCDSPDAAGSDHRPWKHLYTISGYHDRTIFSVHWSSANGLIASGAADDCLRIFADNTQYHSSLGEGNPFKMILKKEKAHSTDVNCVRWHPKDPRLLASAGDDGTVKIWEIVGDMDKLMGRPDLVFTHGK